MTDLMKWIKFINTMAILLITHKGLTQVEPCLRIYSTCAEEANGKAKVPCCSGLKCKIRGKTDGLRLGRCEKPNPEICSKENEKCRRSFKSEDYDSIRACCDNLECSPVPEIDNKPLHDPQLGICRKRHPCAAKRRSSCAKGGELCGDLPGRKCCDKVDLGGIWQCWYKKTIAGLRLMPTDLGYCVSTQ